MGTRADFYLRSGKQLKKEDWLGSIAWDGYPEGMPDALLKAKSKKEFLKELAIFFRDRDDVTRPDEGWPWPWETSATTDYTYIFSEISKKVTYRCFDKKTRLPDMTSLKNVQRGSQKSGVIVVELCP